MRLRDSENGRNNAAANSCARFHPRGVQILGDTADDICSMPFRWRDEGSGSPRDEHAVAIGNVSRTDSRDSPQGPVRQRSCHARHHHRNGVRTAALAGALWHLTFPDALSAQTQLQTETIREFDIHVQAAESQFAQRLAGESPFLWSSENSTREHAVSVGEIVVGPSSGQGWHEIQGGLVHDWSAAVLVPGVRVEQLVHVVTSYDTHATTYAPSVIRSRILEREGHTYRVAMRVLAKNVLTAVLDTEHHAEYAPMDELRWWGRSQSISIREVRRPGHPEESLRPPGDDNGYLWRLRVFWRFAQTGTGVIAEHRAISLTRSIPKALRWMLRPILIALPRRSLDEMMRKTRESALANAR